MDFGHQPTVPQSWAVEGPWRTPWYRWTSIPACHQEDSSTVACRCEGQGYMLPCMFVCWFVFIKKNCKQRHLNPRNNMKRNIDGTMSFIDCNCTSIECPCQFQIGDVQLAFGFMSPAKIAWNLGCAMQLGLNVFYASGIKHHQTHTEFHCRLLTFRSAVSEFWNQQTSHRYAFP